MEKNILGEYDFRNNTAINVSVNYKDQLDITILHETVHMILTRGTKWGLFSYIIRRVQVYDDSYKHIMNYLSEQSRKVQEAIAVFAECIYIINKYGYERYIEYITYLKRNNK